jgi:hypothetical protein
MRFYYLSSLQKLDVSLTTLMFCIFIGFLRPLLLGIEINSRNIIATTLIFFAWYGMTLIMTNAITYETSYNKLTNI